MRRWTRNSILPLLVILFISSTVVMVGPVSPFGAQLPDEEVDSHPIATGSANVSIQHSPAHNLTLSPASHQDGFFILRFSKTVVEIENISGRPLLTYKVQLTELGYSRSTIATLEAGREGRLVLEIEPVTISESRVQRERYRAEVFIVLRASGEYVLYKKNVTVHVER